MILGNCLDELDSSGLLRLSEGLAIAIQRCTLEPSEEESLLEYLTRLRGHFSDASLAALEPTVQDVKRLLPMHLPIMKALMRKYGRDYECILRSTIQGGEGHEAFWGAINTLQLLVHLEPEVISELERRGTCELRLVDKGAFNVFWCRFQETCLQAIFAAISVPDGLSARWTGMLFARLLDDYIELRSKMIFDHILDYPDSESSIIELRDSVYPGSLQIVTRAINDTFIQRLVFSQVDTIDILGQIGISVDVLRQLDPTGFLLDRLLKCLKPFIRYKSDRPARSTNLDLSRSRKDGKRLIITTLIGLCNDPEYSGQVRQVREVRFDATENPYFQSLLENWLPDPIESVDDMVGVSCKVGSLFEIMANILENVEELISEYQLYLAEKLLASGLAVLDPQIVVDLELFKAKFPSPGWHSCDAMLNDVNLSRKLALCSSDRLTSTLVVSHLYWPEQYFNNGSPRAYPIDEAKKQFAAQYSLQSSSLRSLTWRPIISQVTLQVDFNNNSFDFSCNEIEAQLLSRIAESAGPSTIGGLEALLETEGWDPKDTRSALQFWLNKRVVVGDKAHRFRLADNYDPHLQDYTDVRLSS